MQCTVTTLTEESCQFNVLHQFSLSDYDLQGYADKLLEEIIDTYQAEIQDFDEATDREIEEMRCLYVPFFGIDIDKARKHITIYQKQSSDHTLKTYRNENFGF